MKEGLIALQFWEGDRAKGSRLAQFIADLEPSKRADVDFMFLARPDCNFDPAVVSAVSRKFQVVTHKPNLRAVGHPWACWVMFYSVLEWVYRMKTAGKVGYKWVLCFEPDCVPVSTNWINELKEEYNRLNTYIVGSETFHWQMHLNGNAMYSCDLKFLEWFVRGVTVQGVPQRQPYDIWLFPQFAQWGVGYSRKIANRCGQKTMPPAEAQWLKEKGLSFIHGVKDDSLFYWARQNLR